VRAKRQSNCLLETESRAAVRRRPGCPVRVAVPSVPGRYALATGEAATYHLRSLHRLYGPGSRFPVSGTVAEALAPRLRNRHRTDTRKLSVAYAVCPARQVGPTKLINSPCSAMPCPCLPV